MSRRTIELQLNKAEALNVDQTLFGRMLGYGTLRVIGTGGTTEVFSIGSHPAKSRTALQAQMSTIFDRPGIIAAPTSNARRATACRHTNRLPPRPPRSPRNRPLTLPSQTRSHCRRAGLGATRVV